MFCLDVFSCNRPFIHFAHWQFFSSTLEVESMRMYGVCPRVSSSFLNKPRAKLVTACILFTMRRNETLRCDLLACYPTCDWLGEF